MTFYFVRIYNTNDRLIKKKSFPIGFFFFFFFFLFLPKCEFHINMRRVCKFTKRGENYAKLAKAKNKQS